MFKPKVLLITGGMGFIGSNFIHHLLASKPEVHIINLDLGTYAAADINLEDLPDPARHTLIYGNIADRSLVDSILEKYNVNAIINFAAESHVDRSIDAPSEFIQTNIVGTFTLLEAARSFWQHKKQLGVADCRFYHISTDEIYGCRTDVEQPSFFENDPYDPHSPYAATKAASNHLVNAYYHTYNLPILISNCTNNYGPRQHTEKFIPKIIDACLNLQPIPIYGNGENIRDWLYVLDHCAAIELILESGFIGNEYNISAGNEVSNLQIVETVCGLMDLYVPKENKYRELIKFVPDRPGHDWRYSLNCSKLTHKLGWAPKINFVDGLNRTINFYLKAHNLQFEKSEVV